MRFGSFSLAIVTALSLRAAAQDPQIDPAVRIDVAGGTAAANETAAAASPARPGTVVAGWNDWRESTNVEIIRMGVGLTFDGGATWQDFLVRPPGPFQTTVEGDPMATADPRTGTIWVGAIAFAPNGGLFVARLDPQATQFQPSVMAHVAGNLDKCWMAAGPRPGLPDTTRVYVAYNLGVIWSDDMGQSWTTPVSLGPGLGFLPRVGPGGELYVAYWHLGSNEYRLQRSLNGGQSLTTHLIAQRMDTFGIEVNNTRFPGTFRVPPLVYLAVDPNDGTLYAVYFDTTSELLGVFDVDVYFTRSEDQGTTWTMPVVMNGDSLPAGDQFFPWIEVDPAGRLHLVYFDSRHTQQPDEAVNGMFDAYYAWSADRGDTWTEHRLTTPSWNSDNDGLNRPSQFLGDYLCLAHDGEQAYPVYLDTGAGDPDVFTRPVSFPAVPGDVTGDGIVDVQDLVEVVLQWGDCPAQPEVCPADTNDDGVVDVEDLVNVVVNWS
jgi:hypothetical protein